MCTRRQIFQRAIRYSSGLNHERSNSSAVCPAPQSLGQRLPEEFAHEMSGRMGRRQAAEGTKNKHPAFPIPLEIPLLQARDFAFQIITDAITNEFFINYSLK
jgi:hypothetical protein